MHTLWRIELLGELRAVQGSRVVTRFRSRKTGLLLAYLAYYRDRPQRREQLCELLWPEGNPETALANLRNTLRWLRQELEPPGVPAGTVLLADRSFVQLGTAARWYRLIRRHRFPQTVVGGNAFKSCSTQEGGEIRATLWRSPA